MNRFSSPIVIAALAGVLLAPSAQAQKSDTPSSLLQFNKSLLDIEGDGYMVTGDLWDTVMPFNTEQPGLLGSPFRALQGGLMSYMHLGPEDAAFFNPGGMWPNAYRIVNLFRNARKFGFTGFDPDGWPGYQAGNPIYDLDNGKDSRYMVAMYGPNVYGANDAARNYRREAVYTDETRTHLVYEAGWPTTAGVDFKLRAHQYTPNEQNLNDFVVLEITMTNTGFVDSNADGTPEAQNHVVEAIAASMQGETAPSIKIGYGGDRTRGPDGGSTFGAGRTFGYVGAPDEDGNPTDLFTFFANVPPGVTSGGTVPAPGARDFGINNYANKDGYTDVWHGWRWMGVKQGSIQDAISGTSVNEGALSAVTASSPDKMTLFGTHPIGVGPERGWYTSHTFQPQLVTYRWNDSKKEFQAATAVWYADYGRTTDGGTTPANLGPNSRFFSAGTGGDVTTFVPGAGGRPNGDYKYGPAADPTPGSGVQQPIWEAAWNPALRNNPSPSNADFYQAIGYNREWTFGESNKYGVGPFRLGVGESMTIVYVAAAGFRLEGVQDAARAAEWAWERGWRIRNDLPVPPAPEMKIGGTAEGYGLISWNDVRNIDPDVDGYKVWRATQYRRYEWLEEGMRLADRYHHQHEVGLEKDPFKDDVNPFFDYAFNASDIDGTYQPEEWGTYELVAKIPADQLAQYEADGAYDYAFVDEATFFGFTYWYYVSAYKEGGWTGPQGPVTVGHLESSGVVNRNGRNTNAAEEGVIGMGSPWYKTYPFAWNHPDFPRPGTLSRKNMGASFTVTPPVAPADQVRDLITVTPNPYKITGLNDVRNNPSSHDIKFLNVPESFTLTIIDVAGQIIFRQDVDGQTDGQYIWNMFSKDGVEVASGLYIYHIRYGNDQEAVGHFAILR